MWHRRSVPVVGGLTSGRMVFAAVCVLVALESAWPSAARAQVAESSERVLPIYPLPKKPTKERILEFLKGGVEWGTDVQFTFKRDGTASWRVANGSGGCVVPARFVVDSGSIQFECLVESRMPSSKKRVAFKLEVVFVSAELLAFRREGNDARWIVSDCTLASDGSRSCMSELHALIEFLPGATDKSLFQAVKRRVQHLTFADDVVRASHPLLFEGPPAHRPRVESEVFFANDHESEAQELSRILNPLIGAVPVKAWPGDSEYDIVVVVGSKVAEPPGLPPEGSHDK